MQVSANCRIEGFSSELSKNGDIVDFIRAKLTDAIYNQEVHWIGGTTGGTQWARKRFTWMGNVYETHQDGQTIVTISKLYPVPECDTEDSDEELMMEAMAEVAGLDVVCVEVLPNGWGQF